MHYWWKTYGKKRALTEGLYKQFILISIEFPEFDVSCTFLTGLWNLYMFGAKPRGSKKWLLTRNFEDDFGLRVIHSRSIGFSYSYGGNNPVNRFGPFVLLEALRGITAVSPSKRETSFFIVVFHVIETFHFIPLRHFLFRSFKVKRWPIEIEAPAYIFFLYKYWELVSKVVMLHSEGREFKLPAKLKGMRTIARVVRCLGVVLNVTLTEKDRRGLLDDEEDKEEEKLQEDAGYPEEVEEWDVAQMEEWDVAEMEEVDTLPLNELKQRTEMDKASAQKKKPLSDKLEAAVEEVEQGDTENLLSVKRVNYLTDEAQVTTKLNELKQRTETDNASVKKEISASDKLEAAVEEVEQGDTMNGLSLKRVNYLTDEAPVTTKPYEVSLGRISEPVKLDKRVNGLTGEAPLTTELCEASVERISEQEELETLVEEQHRDLAAKDNDDDDDDDDGQAGVTSNVSRSEKKSRKAIMKLGMIPVCGVSLVTMKCSNNARATISQPDVFWNPTTGTHVIFGQLKMV